MDFKGIIYGGKQADVNDQHARDMITDAFLEGKAYAAGDLCIYKNALYRFTAKKEAGAWDSTVAQRTTLEELYDELNSNLFVIKSQFGPMNVANPTIDFSDDSPLNYEWVLFRLSSGYSLYDTLLMNAIYMDDPTKTIYLNMGETIITVNINRAGATTNGLTGNAQVSIYAITVK